LVLNLLRHYSNTIGVYESKELSPLKLSYSFIPLFLVFFTPRSHEQANSKNAAPKPIETTVCKIMENPSAFNNKLVKVRGYVSVSFEFSTLQAEGCTDALWFAIGDGSAPPGLVATVIGSGRPGGKNSEGAPVKAIPVKLARDANYEKFEHYMTVKSEDKPCWDLLSEPTPPDCDVHQVTATFIGRIDSRVPHVSVLHVGFFSSIHFSKLESLLTH
jgi:hypothetical protein